MCTLTIDGIDDVLEHEINAKAELFGLSQTEMVRRILAEALLDKFDERRKMFAPFCGVWTSRDAAEFKEATQDLETVNSGEWE